MYGLFPTMENSFKEVVTKDSFTNRAELLPIGFKNSRKVWILKSSIRDNSILIECDQLPHKDDAEFDGIYIVPARKGKFKVSVSLMCSEYIEPEVHDIEFEIV